MLTYIVDIQFQYVTDHYKNTRDNAVSVETEMHSNNNLFRMLYNNYKHYLLLPLAERSVLSRTEPEIPATPCLPRKEPINLWFELLEIISFRKHDSSLFHSSNGI